jgi:beta-glucanase (GH16 family)
LGLRVIDDFESGLPAGTDGDGNSIGFYTFNGAAATVALSASSTPPAPALPGMSGPNNVLQVDIDSASWAGLIHNFENDSLDTWIAQDWSGYEGIRFWMHGSNSGTEVFVDLLENRNPGSTVDDAERWMFTFVDDFSGWQKFEIPFVDFARKDIGNGAPNDGLTLKEVYGWAFGTLSTPGPVTYYFDNVALFGLNAVPPLEVGFVHRRNFINEGTIGEIWVRLNRPMTPEDPAHVSVDYATEAATSIATEGRDYAGTAGTLTFFNGGPPEQAFPIETFDDTKHEGNERIALRLSNPVNAGPGFLMQSSGIVLDNDPFDPWLLDDFERGAYLWWADSRLALNTPEIWAGSPLARPGQDEYEHILDVSTPIAVDTVVAGSLCNRGKGVVPVVILTTDDFDATTVDHTTVRFGDATEAHSSTTGPTRHEEDFEGDGDIDLVFHFRVAETGYDCNATDTVLTGETFGGQWIAAGGSLAFGRDFPMAQDWTDSEALRFWFFGTGSGNEIGVTLKDNRVPDPGPLGWNLSWSDEFNEPAGTPPNSARWGLEIGDVTRFGDFGWGDGQLQYYTDDPANAATDGNGYLAITLREADGTLQCYYGTCDYTSARLVSRNRAEFAYGRIESRIKMPQGTGIWPAFWGLGTDIDRVGWPQAGEIDFVEFVGRLPDEIFGAIQGPGYAGGTGFGAPYQFGYPAYENFHTFTVEWQPDLIEWYVDGILYHMATPADVAPFEWVFNDPAYLLLNVAAGGNFGGPISDDVSLPQSLLVDYIRVYQAADTAERFEASFVDNFTGWQEVVIPFTAFTRSAEQPADAPNDGLGLNEVWGYGFELRDGGTAQGSLRVDMVRLEPIPPPTEITIWNTNDSGDGSLRQALEDIAIGGTIFADPALAGGAIMLTTGPLVPAGDVTVDASAAPGLTLDGAGSDRVLIIDAGLTVNLSYLTISNGFGWQLAGGIFNNGTLLLDHVTVSNNLMATDAGDFWQGGAGIYNGEGANLVLMDSTVSNNSAGWSGGGIYSFFGTTTTIIRSTVSGNLSNDVGGGLRLLGDAYIVNSTISGNEATGWYGGALFLTDGTVEIVNSTVVDNVSPPWAPAAMFVGTFTDSSASMNLVNSIVAQNLSEGCFLAPFGSGFVALNSIGHNVFSDATCFPVASDQVVGAAAVGPLADNGGPTLTHALLSGSPAIDTADTAVCPTTDQRGVARDAACDVGAVEFVP